MENDLYFFTFYILDDKEVKENNFILSGNQNEKIECILSSEIKESEYYIYFKIFKISKLSELSKNKYHFKYYINDDIYEITFDNKKNRTFIFDVNLRNANKYLIDIPKSELDLHILSYEQKLDYFIQALEQNKETDKINELYKDTIKIFFDKKSFSLLISLFIKIYQNKDLCTLLLNKFKEINLNQKDNYEAMDRINDLKKYVSKFNEIESEAKQLIDKNNYDIIEFYGVILAYLNYYDYNNFLLVSDKLYKENPEALYEILLIYYSHILNPINQKIDFLEKFINYTIINKELSTFRIALNYVEDLEIFIYLIEKIKEIYIKKYVTDDSGSKYEYIIKVGGNRKLETKQKSKIIQYIESINNFSFEKNKFFVHFLNCFWTNILKSYNEPKKDNIYFCFKLREAFKKYYELVIKIFKQEKISSIINETTRYEFDFVLNHMINKFIQNNNSLSDIEKLKLIVKYNPYFIEKEYSKMEVNSILDYLDFNHIDNFFIEYYRGINFEIIFKDNINEYISKIISKIKTISDFSIIKLINFENIDKKEIILKYLFDNIIIKEIDSLNGTKLDEALKIIANLTIIYFSYANKENRFEFIENRINKLCKNLVSLIYIDIFKLIIQNEEEKNVNFKDMEKFIIKKFTDEVENNNDIDNIINLLDYLEEQFKNKTEKNEKIIDEFLEELLEKNSFAKREFFSRNKNIKISLFIKLYEKGKIQKNNIKHFKNTLKLLKNIEKDIKRNITKKTLDEFMLNDESIIKGRFGLIKMINEEFNPSSEFELLKQKNIEINNGIKKLKYIRDNIIIYHKFTYRDIIKKIENIFKTYSKLNIDEYIKGINGLMKECEKLKFLADKINKVKNFLLFNAMFENKSEKDEVAKFNLIYDKFEEIRIQLKEKNDINKLYESNKEIFNKIMEIVNYKEEKIKIFINDMIEYYNIPDKNISDSLNLLFKNKINEYYINNINSFLDFLGKGDDSDDNILKYTILPYFLVGLVGLNLGLGLSLGILSIYGIRHLINNYLLNSEKEKKKISDKTEFDEMESAKSKNNEINNYQEIPNLKRLFFCLYNKKEAIDFLLTKDFDELKGKLLPTDRTINFQDLIDGEKCKKEVIRMKEIQNKIELLSYIQNLDEETINKFEKYSKIYKLIMEFDRNSDNSGNIYEQVINIINNATFHIFQDSEKFIYYDKGLEKKEISFEKLKDLKNRIYIKKENIFQKENNEEKIIFHSKSEILNFFRNIISNLEIIMECMNVLRTKGSSLPIRITLKIDIKNNKQSIIYYLEDKEESFEAIKYFLFNAKNNYTSLMDLFYKEKSNLRFLYGKQFMTFIKHIEGEEYDIESYLRYILNISDNNILIKEGLRFINRKVMDYINNNQLYIKDSLDIISNYINSIFKINKMTIEDNYKQMEIKSCNDKGIYLYECENNSKEVFIIKLFLNKTNKLPTAQNILIISEETSYEELQAFFYRAILCDYHNLFAILINNSFTKYHYNKIFFILDRLLSYKYHEITNKIIDKKKPDYFINSSIVFIYDKENKDIKHFLHNILKNNLRKIEACRIIDNIDDDKNYYFSELGNIKVVTSDFCGLGKSEKIRKMIENNKKNYFHFPLGGKLVKKILTDKLKDLLYKIKNVNYKDVAIHLDLYETKEIEIMNEFLFSFLITKFYFFHDDIYYIPKDISIYIEIPNCFEDYLLKFRILNFFHRENITFDNKPKFNFSNEIINIFNRHLMIYSNEKLEEFIKEYIGIQRYSFHQINIFIKLFTSQYYKFTKIKILKDGKDYTEKHYQEFAESTKYFTMCEFAKLLTERNKIDNIDKLEYIYKYDIDSNTYNKPLILINIEKHSFDYFYVSENYLKQFKSSNDYLKRLKDILDLPNDIEKDKGEFKSLLSILEDKDNKYIITNDNFKKMVLIIYRIKSNIPVIIMGEKGCGKTALILKLNQLLYNGEITVHKINIHQGITENYLCDIIQEKNEFAKKQENKELWLFFNEINNCLCFPLITEIFINRSYNGKKLNDNIRLIGACNPYRRKKFRKQKNVLNFLDNNGNYNLVYQVKPLPQSLLYYVFSFGSINEIDEKKCTYNIIEKLFTKEENNLHRITTEAISICFKFLRNINDFSIVSLKELSGFIKCVEFFESYFTKKNYCEEKINNKKNNKLRSIVCSIYICYYSKIESDNHRNNFNYELKRILLNLINNEKTGKSKGNLIDLITNCDLKNEIISNSETINNFSDFIKNEQNYLINQIELNEGIGKNNIIKENIFISFVCVVTKIPIIIIGKPGTSKSLSIQLLIQSMKGKYSHNKFFKQYPPIIETYFQGSESTNPKEIERLFNLAKKKLNNYNNREELPISLIIFYELGLADRSVNNPIEVIHSELDFKNNQSDGVSFIGISNYSFETSKINSAFVLSVQNLDERLDELNEISYSIAESYLLNMKNNKIYEILSRTYFEYKMQLHFIKDLVVIKKYINSKNIENNDKISYSSDLEEIKLNCSRDISVTSTEEETGEVGKIEEENIEFIRPKSDCLFEKKQLKEFKDLIYTEKKIKIDFHGNYDFYNLIKGITNYLVKTKDKSDNNINQIIKKYIERNFGGIEYEIDIDFNLNFEDIMENIKFIKDIFSNYNLFEKNKKIKLNSAIFFKILYNIQCDYLEPFSCLKIDENSILDYNVYECIKDNINDNNRRYLLLGIEPFLSPFIYQYIKLQNPFKDIKFYERSPFINDNSEEYIYKIKNDIIDDLSDNKIIIINNFQEIYQFLYNLCSLNYLDIEGRKYARIYLNDFNEINVFVNEGIRIIILEKKNFLSKLNIPFLNRFEKINISFENLLGNTIKEISNNLIDEINLKNIIGKYDKDINYSLRDLLINCENQEIEESIYNYATNTSKIHDQGISNENDINEEKIKENVITKICNILPQDIIAILPDNNIIKEIYLYKNIYSLKDYLNKKENMKYKISIIYTFTPITNIIEGVNSNIFMISKIKSENEFINIIDQIKLNNTNNMLQNNNIIFFHFMPFDSNKLKFICFSILCNSKNDNYNYIFIMHIHRNFKKEIKEKIYSFPDILSDINQIFIDNLNGNNKIKSRDLLTNDISTILVEYKKELKLDFEFDKTLSNFLENELINYGLQIDNHKEYIKNIKNFMNNEKFIKEKIIQTMDKIIECKNCKYFKDIFKNICMNSFVNKFTIDINTCFIEYIKEEIFNKYLKIVFKYLEDNNILTTIIENENGHYQFISKNIIKEIIIRYLEEINLENQYSHKSKFLLNYKIPGFYNFFINISNYIYNAISPRYIIYENKIRKLIKKNDCELEKFHEIEEKLLNQIYKEIDNNNFISGIISFIPEGIIFNDYITYYLQKYKDKKIIYNTFDIYHNIIELLIKLRFNKENKIIKKSNNSRKILLIKIIWLESNITYILNILEIIENAKLIFDNNENLLYIKIKDLINSGKLRYITNKERNPEQTKEINECYYLLLASICYCITSEEIQIIEFNDENKNKNNYFIKQIEINYYYGILKNINIILQSLNDDLHLFLNEMYIIDELIKIIELFRQKNIYTLNKIKYYLRLNVYIIQIYSNIDDKFKLTNEFMNNFEMIYKLITNDEEIKSDSNYYNKLRYIFINEIEKTSDINYKNYLLNKLLKEKELIKTSNYIFQILLGNYLVIDNFSLGLKNLLNEDDIIIKTLEKNLNNNFVLEETLLSLFEENSLIYFNKAFFENKPTEIFKDCIKFLDKYIKKQEEIGLKPKELYKLVCIGYIKAFCYTFIKMFNCEKPKWKNQKIIINVFNKNNSICKMVRLYIYKILFNKNNINFFYKEENIDKYKLNEYKDFKDIFQIKNSENLFKINHKVKTLNEEYYEEIYQLIKKYEKSDFKNVKNTKEFNMKKYGIDNFFVLSYNLIISNLDMKGYSNSNKDFYYNICYPLFNGDNKLSKAIELFYNPEQLNEIQKEYNINSNNIIQLLYGYRFCLNELYFQNEDGIYYSLYDNKNIKIIINKYYPGNDSKINKVYSEIINHFESKSDEGCYVCLCNNWYYHCVPSGFPGNNELDKKCPKCNKNIGLFREGSELKIVNRKDYIRIFKDEEEIEKTRKDKIKGNIIKEINYMTLKEFKSKYIYNEMKKEKGICLIDENSFKNDHKIIRNLSQISYRLLNYILYTHLFFSRIILSENYFDKYLPKRMSWVETLNECWILLKNELSKKNVNCVESFMEYIFTDLFPILNQKKNIDEYEDLINFEDYLEKKIQEMIIKFKRDKEFLESKEYKDNNNEKSLINLLTEKIRSVDYNFEEYPFYQYFYYTNYLDEEYINEILKHKDKDQYPVLSKYLELRNNHEQDKNKYLINNFNLFNYTLNLINLKYSNNITRKYAEKQKLKDAEIYLNNKELFDNFIKFYNNLQIEDINKKNLELRYDNPLCDYFIDENNNFGKTYKILYKIFINYQNEKIENLLDLKINRGTFNVKSKNRIDVQYIKPNEIFNLNQPKNFIHILYNSSYRKILDCSTKNYELYNAYMINLDLIEEYMTNSLLKNKKLLNERVHEFKYSNEDFDHHVSDSITLFKTNYSIRNIDINDKLVIYKLYKEIENNIYFHKQIILDFLYLIKYLNQEKVDDINKKIYEILFEIEYNFSDVFKNFFVKEEKFTVDKIIDIFDFYLILIFENTKNEIKDFQEELDHKSLENIKNYFSKKHLIGKKDLSHAIRLYISLVLFLEEDKENKIKLNYNNVISYLNSKDLWENDIYNNKEYLVNLNELKSLNIKICQIIPLYETLGNDIENNIFDDIKQIIKDEEARYKQEWQEDYDKMKDEDEDDDDD